MVGLKLAAAKKKKMKAKKKRKVAKTKEWSKSIMYQWATYYALVILEELDPAIVDFSSAEKTPLQGLRYFVVGSSGGEAIEDRQFLAALNIYDVIVRTYRPEWQNHSEINTTQEAVDEIVSVLSDGEKSISELANEIDEVFRFSDE